MKNKNIKILIIIIAILLFTVLVIYLKNKTNNYFTNGVSKKEIMSEEEKKSIGLYHLGEYEVLARDDSGKIITYKLNKLLDEKPIEIEFMSDDAKKEHGFSPDVKIQVLQKDESGKIVAYKIIKTDSDVISRY